MIHKCISWFSYKCHVIHKCISWFTYICPAIHRCKHCYMYFQTNEWNVHLQTTLHLWTSLHLFVDFFLLSWHGLIYKCIFFFKRTFSAAYHMNINVRVWLNVNTLRYICAVSTYLDYYTIMDIKHTTKWRVKVRSKGLRPYSRFVTFL